MRVGGVLGVLAEIASSAAALVTDLSVTFYVDVDENALLRDFKYVPSASVVISQCFRNVMAVLSNLSKSRHFCIKS